MLTKRQFRARGKYKDGLESEEIEEDWAHLDRTSHVRDFKGRNGTLRLEVDLGDSNLADTEKYIESATKEGSQRLKKPKDQDLEALRAFALSSAGQSSDGFLQGSHTIDEMAPGMIASSVTKAQKRASTGEPDEAEEEAAPELEIESNARTLIYDKAVTKWDGLGDSVRTASRAAWDCLEEAGASLIGTRGDTALNFYMETLNARVQTGLLFLDETPQSFQQMKMLANHAHESSVNVGTEATEADRFAQVVVRAP